MRLRLLICTSLLLGGCAAAAAVAAIPGVVVDRTVSFFNGQDASLALDMQRSLAAVQQGFEHMSLRINVLEPVADGYMMEFGNGELDGEVHLLRQTQNLTTLSVSAHRGLVQQASVETAMLKEVRSASEQQAGDARFDFAAYANVYAQAGTTATRIGWFRPGAKLHVSAVQESGWLKIKLPSGQSGFIKGSMKGEGA